MPQPTSPPEVIMLATASIENYARYSRAAWEKFCAVRGYGFFHYPDKLLSDMHINWSKIEMVRRHLAATKADIVVLVDADTYVCDPKLKFCAIADSYPDKDLLFSRDCRNIGPLVLPLNYQAALKYKTRKLPNAGFVLIRNSEFSRKFFDKWLDLARNELRALADTHPRNQRVLWEGLYFQNADKIALLARQVERVRHVAHIEGAIRNGAKVIHVKEGLTEGQARELEDRINATNQ
jgi:hypothetical protein